MGTSSSRAGKYSLQGGEWRQAKSKATSFANNTGAGVADVAAAFAKACIQGGAITGSEIIAQVGGALGGFFEDAKEVGFEQALRNVGLEHLIGKAPDEVLSGLADHFCTEAGAIEDSVARAAVLDVIGELFEDETGEYQELRESWDQLLEATQIKSLLEMYLSQCIFSRLLVELGECFNSEKTPAIVAAAKEAEIKEFIKSMVSLEVAQIDSMAFDWGSQEGKDLIERTIAAALAQIEAAGNES